MKYIYCVLTAILVLYGCQEVNKKDLSADIRKIDSLQNEQSNSSRSINKASEENSITEQWNRIVFEKGVCLRGSQYVTHIKRDHPTFIFNGDNWKKFASNNERELTNFLIAQLSDTTKTKVHTCPFFQTTIGEMAVYSLQHIHAINWFEFSEFKDYKNRESKNDFDQPQMWLQNILKNEIDRNKLAELYRSELKK